MVPSKAAIKFDKLPTHIAIIMDGNGRWAKKRHLPRMAGHRAGTENLRNIIKACVEFGVKYLTVYAFSTENWKRSQDEVDGLLMILADVLEKEIEELHQQGVCLRHIGRLEKLDPKIQEKINSAIQLTKNNDRLILNIAWNYGGRDEIIYAVQRVIEEGIKADEITKRSSVNFFSPINLRNPIWSFALREKCAHPITSSGKVLTRNGISRLYYGLILAEIN
jgi:undecaprenyl diphosphate synthase